MTNKSESFQAVMQFVTNGILVVGIIVSGMETVKARKEARDWKEKFFEVTSKSAEKSTISNETEIKGQAMIPFPEGMTIDALVPICTNQPEYMIRLLWSDSGWHEMTRVKFEQKP